MCVSVNNILINITNSKNNMVIIRRIIFSELDKVIKLSDEIFGNENFTKEVWTYLLFTGTILAALENEIIVGFIIVIPYPNPFFATACSVCPAFIAANRIEKYHTIYAFGIAETHRKKGIGSMLFSAGLNLTKELPVFLHVRVSNEDAIRLYKKHGFHINEDRELDCYTDPENCNEDGYMMYRI
jgi:ribosomal protein S18 acetylase RimI-like enzyme